MFFRTVSRQSKKSLFSLGSIVLMAALLLTACSPQASQTEVSTSQPTQPIAPPTTQAPTPTMDEYGSKPTQESMPTATMEMSTPETTGVPGTGEDVDTDVQAAAQEIISGTVTVAAVAYDEPGWMVIHADADGSPGPVIGIAPVYPGITSDLVVPIDVTQATSTLYAMLHKDEGSIGLYEFPGEDRPVTKDDMMFSPAFEVQGDIPAENNPAVVVLDQPISNNQVNVPAVISTGTGWMVIHTDDGGSPGPVIGFVAVGDGLNTNVLVEIDPSQAGESLFAMLHTDAGIVGTYEFPGDDVPVRAGGAVVMLPFSLTPMPVEPGGGIGSAVPVSASIFDGSYDPDPLTIPVGTTVTWTHVGKNPHTVTADDGSFDSGSLSNGDTFSFTFNTAGEYMYYCSFHGGPGGSGMSATIVVTP